MCRQLQRRVIVFCPETLPLFGLSFNLMIVHSIALLQHRPIAVLCADISRIWHQSVSSHNKSTFVVVVVVPFVVVLLICVKISFV